ncbi:MAG: septum formation initiator family protein [Firmicutes bacterium]|nr:septum formation initiator family protein [Bacillota bacterium]
MSTGSFPAQRKKAAVRPAVRTHRWATGIIAGMGGLGLIALLISAVQAHAALQAAEWQKQQAQRAFVVAQQQHQQLKESQAAWQDASYAAEVARDQFLMIKPGERIFVFPANQGDGTR